MAMGQIIEEKAVEVAGSLLIHPVVPSGVLFKDNPQLKVICWEFFKGKDILTRKLDDTRQHFWGKNTTIFLDRC